MIKVNLMHKNYGEASVKSVNVFRIIFIYSGCLFKKKILFLTTNIEFPRERHAQYQRYMKYLNLNVWGFGGISATYSFPQNFCKSSATFF